jgi:thiol:disulfide interchange protein/DsbC/DsbD-like thiol-disulfide interchange protein
MAPSRDPTAPGASFMTQSSRRLASFVFAALAAAGSVAAAPVRTAHVEAELVPAATALVPGEPLTVALRLKMDKGWHTYWQNPGDSGLPTTLAWQLPSGLKAGAIQWPPPRALPVGPLTNYGYEGEVLLVTDIATSGASSGTEPATLRARADWLVCKEICIPEGADLALTLPAGRQSAPDPQWAEAIARTRASIPRPLLGWNIAATGQGPQVELTLGPLPGDPGDVRFFPFSAGKIEPSAPQKVVRDGATLKLVLPVASQRVGEFTRVAGVLTASKGLGEQSAATIDVPLAGNVVAGAAIPNAAAASSVLAGSEAQGGDLSLGVALLFALAGGLLLNLMPCVFPVLSLKVLGFAAHRFSGNAMRAHGIAFGAGVIVSFWVLAGVLLALRAAGGQLGWGFQLQSPGVVVALAVLFFVLALNLSGVFEVGQLLPSSLASWNARNAYANDALSGALAVVIASPCSAPFMGAAIGYGLVQSGPATIAIFTALGVGMALPYVLLAFFPAWRNKLPWPGPWMLRLKQLLAFPLYATVIWLVWVLGAQLDNDAVARLALVLLFIAASLWALQILRSGGKKAWGWGAIAGLVAAVVVGAPVFTAAVAGDAPPPKPLAAVEGPWVDYAPERVRELTDAGRTVFVDFTAAWCVTCQVNKRLVLNTDAVQQAFTQNNVALLRADWTRRDATIGRALSALGRSGVPVYVVYRPGREPLVLPEVLQKQTVIDALESKF